MLVFDWLGMKTGFPLWVSWQLNKDWKEDVESTFEGFAETRKELLLSWASDNWTLMERLRAEVEAALKPELPHSQEPLKMPIASKSSKGSASVEHSVTVQKARIEALLRSTYNRATDMTELFYLDRDGSVAATTHESHLGEKYGADSILHEAMQYAGEGIEGRNCLFGPYRDPVTLRLGARTSSFHDAVTLLFVAPVKQSGDIAGFVCGRVPNDCLGDLIQRESGHIYPDSGDNYLFMAEPVLNKRIKPGTALSRSRFEDHTFTHGENLKDGVKTEWGMVTVKEHTELELLFTDPATGELHPGVANTIRNGSNCFVEFPGYSDYRHIPVIGKGVTFRLPHCPDKWGMMCEGDLEEVYRLRSLKYRQRRLHVLTTITASALLAILVTFVAMQAPVWAIGLAAGGFNLLFGLGVIGFFKKKEDHRVVTHIRDVTRFIRMNAEGKGDLTKRLPLGSFDNDEVKDMAKWLNNMMDSLEGIMLQVRAAASDVTASQRALNDSANATSRSTGRVSGQISEMIGSIRLQLKDIDMAKETADTMRETLLRLEEQAAGQIVMAQKEVERIGDKMGHISSKVGETNQTIRSFMATVQDIQNVLQVIEQISSQTNLLALNASIEAARVGEQGRGFAVVASEIRKLASSTKESTEEVHAITQKIYREAERAYASMDEGTQVVEEGNQYVAAARATLSAAHTQDARKSEVVDAVVQLLENIALVSRENRKVSGEVESRMNELIDEMKNVQQTSQNVEWITTLMHQMVGQFKLTESRIR
ncbi:methyl-accepting chemotaxis protein [Paenibacillus soyae]|uniref:Methyl-accepting chemotaxis protein n=1 Tax=Paenibacillus soyae TaxID=2969249 RepID=A0A9X2MV61_9BACL|nr:methyl-accepting chemotaxis protein [Paenibacillus soyae]MCR2807474.1 methyl-accepting chemotaxis protein [Paenibacillus soyae]